MVLRVMILACKLLLAIRRILGVVNSKDKGGWGL
jgi:hypothetical protein